MSGTDELARRAGQFSYRRHCHEHRRDSHPRSRPRTAQHGLGPDRNRRVAVEFPRVRLDPDGFRDLPRRAAGLDPLRSDGAGGAQRSARGGGRAEKPAGRRICRESRQKDRGWRRSCGEEPGGGHGQDAASRLGRRESGRRRRACGRYLPCAAPPRPSEGTRMIGKLRGVVDGLEEEGLILDVGGVGYLVAASARTLRALPPPGQQVELLIETHVREDAIRLYGVFTAAERDWFRVLQSVQGVGAKVALGILGALTADALSTAIARQDKAMMARAPGVGPKLAARLVLELKDKAPTPSASDFGATDVSVESGAKLTKAADDAILALVSLGYARAQAAAAVARCSATLGGEAQTAALIRAGLKELAQ